VYCHGSLPQQILAIASPKQIWLQWAEASRDKTNIAPYLNFSHARQHL
jgi:arginyl-tRNA synthetase